ncbi:RagB/SusD family nutrient uptake outer membrane protein [Allomuricauda sp. SCSIO 65647]|uniref:RagB/SusD family nutrient uptake outer membrane protein n=1 Tax=Allomuricauda sp. SCSIO 65647 TaxID=2908843 RepID=UPI001F284CC0|nr:RagB/SusD family nutrient uptake outer membrane protein [Muricauda sp. SCSIO 65647]UJH67054.1 RagB/SusD family nutrient uptake outer membrane protein [Muricauda sp. SCSIO 65647]
MKNILIPIVAITLMVSCESNLEEEPFSFITNDNFFNTEEDAISGVNAVYQNLREGGFYGSTYVTLSEVGADIIEYRSDGDAEFIGFDKNQFGSAFGPLNNFWTQAYSTINRANTVIVNTTLDSEIGDRVVAEATFLRALTYFNLVRAFGDVPLVLIPPEGIDNLAIPRVESSQVYDQIITDLNQIIGDGDLPETYGNSSDIGRATLGAAQALLAEIHLTLGNYSEARDLAQQIISSGTYQLFDTYNDVFDLANENGIEHIFSIQYSCVEPQFGSGYAQSFAVDFLYPGFGGLMVNEAFVASFDANDVRSELIYTEKITESGEILEVKQLPRHDKFFDPSPCGNSRAKNNWIVYRFADILLFFAEAENELSGPSGAAYDAVNQIRERAGIAPLEAGLSKEAFQEAVFQERAWELYSEGHRRWDLLRTGRYIQQMESVGIPTESRYVLFPIPLAELDANKELTQNDGY